MAKEQQRQESFGAGVLEAPPAAAARSATPVARIIPEFRAEEAGGPKVTATRLIDFPAEQAAGFKRFKISGRLPGESCWPSVYLVAPSEEAARKVYLSANELDKVPGGERAVVACRELPD